MSTEPKVDPHTRLNSITVQLFIAEYNAMRDEILSRSDRQVQITTIAVLALGTLFAAGTQFQSATLLLIYPLVAAGLCASWSAEDAGIQAQGAYIWRVIEERAHMRWEHFVADNPAVFRRGFRNAVRFFYALSEVAAIILGVSISQQSEIVRAFVSGSFAPQALTADDVLLGLACLSLVGTLYVSLTLPSGSAEWRRSVTRRLSVTGDDNQPDRRSAVPASVSARDVDRR